MADTTTAVYVRGSGITVSLFAYGAENWKEFVFLLCNRDPVFAESFGNSPERLILQGIDQPI